MLKMAIVALLWSMRSTDTGCDQLVTVTPHYREHTAERTGLRVWPAHSGTRGRELGVGTDEHGRLDAKILAVAVTETTHPIFVFFFSP